jgi:hypothetical protein
MGVVGKYAMGVVGTFINENDIFINEYIYPRASSVPQYTPASSP